MKFLISLALILFAFAVETNACQCGGPGQPCAAYGDAAAIFVGTVSFTSSIKIKEADSEYTQRLIRLHVDRPIRNVETSDVEVVTGLGDSDCGFPFRLGGQYLVYANRHLGKLETSICTRTRPLSDATADLEYIKGRSKAAPGGTIFGVVELRRPSRGEEYPLPPLKDAKIVIEGPDKKFERKTDAEGKFSISGLPAGKYKVRIELSEGLSTYDPDDEVQLLDRGCRGTYFEVQPDTRITGKVLDAQGMPAADVLMELVGLDRWIDNAFPQFVKTDKEGRYELKLLKPARYYLGVRIYGSPGSNYIPYPQTYYPGVKDRSQATVITIAEGQRLELEELILPARFIERTLNGVVVDPDGTPVAGAVVWLDEQQYNGEDGPYQRETDSEGRFSFPVYEGIKYELTANVDTAERRVKQSAPLEIVITSNPEPIKLVLKPVPR